MSKFYSRTDELVYEFTLDGTCESIGRVDMCEWNAVFEFKDDDCDLTSAYGAIVTEDGQGFVYVQYFPGKLELDENWEECLTMHSEHGCQDDNVRAFAVAFSTTTISLTILGGVALGIYTHKHPAH